MKKIVESAAATRMWVGAGATSTLYENMVRVGPNLRFGG
jgi:hypothetical protein